MKRAPILVVSFVILFLFTACDEKTTTKSPLEIAEVIVESQPTREVYSNRLTPEDEMYNARLLYSYALDPSIPKDGVILYASGTQAYEIALFQLQSSDDQAEIVEALQNYIKNRIADFYGYAPEQVALLENSTIKTVGQYVVLLVCEDISSAQSAFVECFDNNSNEAALATQEIIELDENGYVVFHQPGEDDMTIYDTSAIITAYHSGDRSALSEKDNAILNACIDVISEVIEANMSD